MDSWEIAIIAVAGYVSVMTLVRMMYRRRDALIDELSQQVELERQHRRAMKQKEEQRQRRKQIRQKRRENAA